MTRAFAVTSVALVSLTASVSALAEPSAASGGQATASASSGLSAPALEREAPSGSAPADSGAPLIFGNDLHVGGYGGVDVMYTRMFDRDGVVVGLQGAVLINHRLAFGLAGYGFSNPAPGPDDADGDAQYFESGYGGLTARYSLLSQELPVYVTVGGLIGAGAIELTDKHGDESEYGSRDNRADDVFAVFQPDVTLHANLTRWMRFGATAGYRFTSGVNHLGFDESDLNGVVLGGHVQFGSF